MGINVDKVHFEPEEYQAFSQKLQQNLDALRLLLQRPKFGEGPATMGAELELFLVDKLAQPLPLNREVLAESLHDLLTVELSRFNLELGFKPQVFSGDPFARLGNEMEESLAEVRRAAAKLDGRVATIGILPTLAPQHMGGWALTDLSRYRALSEGAKRWRQGPFQLQIEGIDSLRFECTEVTAEGSNTSLQIHLRVEPARFAAVYNAAQIATGPVLAASGNSPLFLGHRLWDETRIALFRQSLDDRPGSERDEWRQARVSFGHGWVREGAWELFAENVGFHPPLLPVVSDEDPMAVVRAGGVPKLSELRLHHGTIWRWNRAVYDAADGDGHLRIEFRALPAGPTVLDMMANSAFLVGLTLALEPKIEWFLQRMTFGHARRNFYQAARHGLGGEMLWPTPEPPSPEPQTARELLPQLIDLAHQGLLAHGIAAGESERLLNVIRARVRSGLTGSRWQRETLENLKDEKNPYAILVERYLANCETRRPVHEWNITSA